MTFEEILNTHGKLVYTNVGVSMLPWIHEGKDVMVIEKAPEQLKKYDAVLFIRPGVEGRGKYVLHRIIRCYQDGSFYIMGDNTLCGERVQRKQIIGILKSIQQPGKLIRVTDRDYQCKVWLWWHFGLPVKNILRKGKYAVAVWLRKLLKLDDKVSLRKYLKHKIP